MTSCMSALVNWMSKSASAAGGNQPPERVHWPENSIETESRRIYIGSTRGCQISPPGRAPVATRPDFINAILIQNSIERSIEREREKERERERERESHLSAAICSNFLLSARVTLPILTML